MTSKQAISKLNHDGIYQAAVICPLEQDVKVLDILIRKHVDLEYLAGTIDMGRDVNWYNEYVELQYRQLTAHEFEVIKEAFRRKHLED